jgi:CheY-like chemotaxis protein
LSLHDAKCHFGQLPSVCALNFNFINLTELGCVPVTVASDAFYPAASGADNHMTLVTDNCPKLDSLGDKGYAVQLASDGENGLRMALNNMPDIIVLDMLLPTLGGLEVLRALKQYSGTRDIPVIALSGLPRSNEAKLIREGAVSYLEKSSLENSDALLQAVDDALLLHRQERTPSRV